MNATVSTPCIKVCVVDPVSALCVGCGRTLDEVAAWGAMSEDARRAVMDGLGARLLAMRSRGSRAGRAGRRERAD